MSNDPRAALVAAATPKTVLDVESPELVRTYAEALVNAAQTEGTTEAVIQELEEFIDDLVAPDPRFAALLRAPGVPLHDKDRILVAALEGRALPTVLRFLRVLNRHGRLGLVEAIARRARSIWDERQDRVHVFVRSAFPLDDAQQAALRERLAQLTGATPILHVELDRSLIGGLVVQIGDHVYDASVRNRLQQLRRRLMEGKTHEIQSRRDHFSSPA
jgi:F-type H+-transporting ATPase subunit delta